VVGEMRTSIDERAILVIRPRHLVPEYLHEAAHQLIEAVGATYPNGWETVGSGRGAGVLDPLPSAPRQLAPPCALKR
jgi:hypothetical protein